MVERYIGIENELTSFNNGEQVNFKRYIKNFSKKFSKVYIKSPSSIRTDTGNGFYVDGSELEILTPPIALNKGFATRVTDSLMIGRDKVLEYTPELEHTGYSMHWNLSHNKLVSELSLYESLAIPFQLFGLTPLSIGFNLREKDGSKRYEFLGDSLSSEEQINATALLLGATLYAMEEAKRSPLELANLDFSKKLFIPNGRYSEVQIKVPTANFEGEIQVQQYIELFYQWISPYVKNLGTSKEIRNLKAFIEGNKELEFDRFNYFAFLKCSDAKRKGIYLPFKISSKNSSGQILIKSGKKRDLPLEARLLGNILSKVDDIEYFDWSHLIYKLDGEEYKISGIEEIYMNLSSLPDMPHFNKSQNPRIGKLDLITKIGEREKIKYNPKKDLFWENSLLGHLNSHIRNIRPWQLLKNLIIVSAISYGSIWVGSEIYDFYVVKNEVDSLIENKEVVQNE